MRIEIIGITGKAGSGKDVIALHLGAKYGYERLAYADPLKDALCERFGWQREWWNSREWRERPLPELLDKSPRNWAQWFGNVVRTLDPDLWTNYLEQEILRKVRIAIRDKRDLLRIVISDVRFNNEAFRLSAFKYHAPRLGLSTVDIKTRILAIDMDEVKLPAEEAADISENGIDDKYVNGRVIYGDLVNALLQTDNLVKTDWRMGN